MMVYIDEFIFRGRFMAHIRGAAHPLRAVILGALLYALSKAFQFHIGWAHLVTLGLLGTALSLRAYFNRDFAAGAGMVAGFLIVAHCVFSLPIFGNESQGVVLLRYDIHLDIDAPTVRFLTGGLGGPLSSVVLQTVILVDIIRNFHREQKSLWPLRSAELR